MSTRRLSSADALRRGVARPVAPVPAPADVPRCEKCGRPPVDHRDGVCIYPRPKPARVTLNLPPELYRQLNRWADSAAEQLDVPRVGVQESLRAMVRVVTGGQAANAEQRIIAAIHDELGS